MAKGNKDGIPAGENIHAGHRQRLKKLMLAQGLENMPEHNVLEILLFYSVPKVDTNPIAHRLIERFGSLKDVLEADYEELVQVNGVGDNTASMIKFVQMLSKKYATSVTLEVDDGRLTQTEAAMDFCRAVFLGERTEKAYVIALDSEMRCMGRCQMGSGTLSGVDMNMRIVVDYIVKMGCSSFILTHNHPRGSCLPSKSDLAVTTKLMRTLKPIGITMADHIIVGADGVVSMRSSGYCEGWE